MPQSASQPRTRCRLHCTITRGRQRIHARVMDVSEGGLCIVTPVRFENRSKVQIVIDVPRRGPVSVEGIVRHERPFRQPSSGRRGWATGFKLSEAGPDFRAIATPTGALLGPSRDPLRNVVPGKRVREGGECAPASELPNDSEHQVFRVRLRAAGSPRTRVLTLTAPSENAVREAVRTDLSGDWEITDIELNPLD